MRLEEMTFLGMSREKDPNRDDPIKTLEETREKRKLRQKINHALFDDQMSKIKDQYDQLNGTTIMEDLIKERRDWIKEYKD